MFDDDVAYEVLLEPRWGDGRLTLADVEAVRAAAPAGAFVVVKLREMSTWETGAPEYVGKWLADCQVLYVIEASCRQQAGDMFVRTARAARAQLIGSEARDIAGGAA